MMVLMGLYMFCEGIKWDTMQYTAAVAASKQHTCYGLEIFRWKKQQQHTI